MSDERREAKPGEAVAQLVDSALRLSASMAQVVAEASTGKPQPNRPGDTHLQSIIRHGTTAAGSMLATVVSAARESAGEPDTAGAAEGPAPPAPAPRVVPGGSLRVPLSIDNPGTAAMEGIVPTLAAVRCHGEPSDDGAQVRFDPEVLTIGPHDFEKLAVTITLDDSARPGPWTVDFTLTGQEDQPITLAFEVVPAG